MTDDLLKKIFTFNGKTKYKFNRRQHNIVIDIVALQFIENQWCSLNDF